MSLLEPSKTLDQSQLLWDLLAQSASPVIEAMKEARLLLMAKLSALNKEKAEKPPSQAA